MKDLKTRKDLIRAYVDFFKSKGHREIPSASLIPENDPTVLFTTAGMHPLVPYLQGQKHPYGKRVVSVQKCIRTGDIEEVGDDIHHTFFEMLGNWSFGDYFKEDAIKFSFEFLTSEKWLGIPVEKLAVSVFAGEEDRGIPKDMESFGIWRALGISEKRIAFLPRENNWWGPAGETGPCGPDTEMFYWTGEGEAPEEYDPKDERWVEIWNDVFMQYEKKKRTILVDGMNCLYDKDFNLNMELMNVIKEINAKKILVINNHKEKAEQLLQDFGFEVFSFNGKINKDNLEFFEQLFKKYGLKKNEVLYFDYKAANLETAKKVGINNVLLYKEDSEEVRKFLEKNIYYYTSLAQKNVDTGMGVERTLAVLNGLKDDYQTESFVQIIEEIEKISGRKYGGSERVFRIIADHLRAAVFILGDDKAIVPSNAGRGYVLRRLIRRAVRYGKILGIRNNFSALVGKKIVDLYSESYDELRRNNEFILFQLEEEEKKFVLTLENGLKKLDNILKGSEWNVSGKNAFLLFQSYGFPIEMTVELAKERGRKVDLTDFNEEYKKHQELSRTLSSGQFKSGLADDSEKTTRLHTATHLLNEALRKVLKDPNVKQRGSNINAERLRFDFSFARKLTQEEINEVESLVNEKIERGLIMKRKEMSLREAFDSGAQGEFGAKYPDLVSVYVVIDEEDERGWFSKEICTGPHVNNTKEIGKFKILKEEGVAAGVRRIKATVD